MDKIVLEGIRLDIRVGTTDEERSQPQPCGLDLTLTTDLTTAGQSGDLNQTIDYAAVFRRVEALCTGRSFHLLEEVGHQICKAILSEFPVEKVKLKIRKLIPFSVRLSAVGIELKRYRKKQRRD